MYLLKRVIFYCIICIYILLYIYIYVYGCWSKFLYPRTAIFWLIIRKKKKRIQFPWFQWGHNEVTKKGVPPNHPVVMDDLWGTPFSESPIYWWWTMDYLYWYHQFFWGFMDIWSLYWYHIYIGWAPYIHISIDINSYFDIWIHINI